MSKSNEKNGIKKYTHDKGGKIDTDEWLIE